MQYSNHYPSPLGEILLAADEEGLTGLWFEGQKYYPENPGEERDMPIFDQTKRWLDLYFSGRKPDFTPPLHLSGTPFQRPIWDLLLKIPYGETTTYGVLAYQVAMRRGIDSMSAQAIGGAVGANPISIIVPCHRVLSASGDLTGYAGGLERKRYLLELEKSI